ncbi:PIN domain-containing protein [Phenylobacterium sp.]|uniref:PIN domain-containing protein n=1 Tax=Phenylobacterium sp. TaxID=1871053 RepID=UPI0035B0C28E
MSAERAFLDTNVLLYLLSEDAEKAGRAEALIQAGGVISVQVLNEFANVARRKFAASWDAVHETLDLLKDALAVEPLTLETHEVALALAERYRFSIYDSLILSAALQAGCGVVYSEDLQDGQATGELQIRNPFAGV